MQLQYTLVPQGDRPFDLRRLEARLKQLPGAFRHPDPSDLSFVIAATRDMARYLAAKLNGEPRTSLASQGIITLSERAVGVVQDAPQEVLDQVEGYVTWLMTEVPCRVLSDEGEDWTARYGHDPKALFLEEDPWG